MAKPMFSKGDLVRKCTRSGTPIGPYYKITMANAYQVHMKSTESEKIEITVDRCYVYRPKVARLAISKNMIEKIKKGQVIISHPCTKSWVKLSNDKPDVVKFYTMDGMYVLYCTFVKAEVHPTYEGDTVYLFIDRVIC